MKTEEMLNGNTGTISVIIPTYNGAHKIGNLLTSLSLQSVFEFEVLVVVDGSTDNTVQTVNLYSDRFNALKVLVQENKGRAAVRNFGARMAMGDLLIFFDDDVVLTPETVRKHVEFHRSCNQHSIVAGNIMETESSTKNEIQNYKAFLVKKWMSKYQPGITRMSKDNLFFTAANCSFMRYVFDDLGGFDSRLKDGEDYDLAYRAIEKGIAVFFDKGNPVVHNDEINCKSYILRLREYRESEKQRAKFDPSIKGVVGKNHALKEGLKKGFYWFFSFPMWPRLIDRSTVFNLFPRKIRFKLYDWIIHSLSYVFPNKQL